MKWLKYYPLFLLCEQATIQRGTDPYEYKVEKDHWMARKKTGGSRWFELSGKDYKPKFQSAIDTLDQENPTLRTLTAPKRQGNEQEPIINKEIKPQPKQLITTPPKSSTEKIKEVNDKYLIKEFNFHLIPDGKNNYRSAQLPIRYDGKDFYKDIIERFGIKTVIRLNGDSKTMKNGKKIEDGRHKKEHPITNIQQEKVFLEGLGVKFHKLSSTRSQDKVNELLNQGNVLIHCAHGADRTGGNVGGYLYKIGWGNTEKIWDYSTKYSSWNQLVRNNPNGFVKHGYLDQVKKFGVRDLEHAIKLSN